MASSDELLQQLIEALAKEGCAPWIDDFEDEVIGMVGRLRKARDRAIRDVESARLLPKVGGVNAAIRQCCHRSTVYRRVSRAAKVARQTHSATESYDDSIPVEAQRERDRNGERSQLDR